MQPFKVVTPPALPKGISILIVDDDSELVGLMVIFLAHEGASVVVAASAREAVAVLESQPIDVVMSDINMPSEDGYWLIDIIRHSDQQAVRNVPAVAVTAAAGPEARERALGMGFDEFVGKPVDLALLLEKIDAACQHAR